MCCEGAILNFLFLDFCAFPDGTDLSHPVPDLAVVSLHAYLPANLLVREDTKNS